MRVILWHFDPPVFTFYLSSFPPLFLEKSLQFFFINSLSFYYFSLYLFVFLLFLFFQNSFLLLHRSRYQTLLYYLSASQTVVPINRTTFPDRAHSFSNPFFGSNSLIDCKPIYNQRIYFEGFSSSSSNLLKHSIWIIYFEVVLLLLSGIAETLD